jgi:hypothetical protein
VTATSSTPTSTAPPTNRHSRKLGILPFIGLILFTISAIPILRDPGVDWQRQLVQNGVVFLIGWAGIGAGISHLFFAKKTAASIGWARSPFETEVGFADLAMGAAGLMAASRSTDFWLAVIVISSIFRVGCGLGHIRQMIRQHDHAPNNTAVLAINFGVPLFLGLAYLAWI